MVDKMLQPISPYDYILKLTSRWHCGRKDKIVSNVFREVMNPTMCIPAAVGIYSRSQDFCLLPFYPPRIPDSQPKCRSHSILLPFFT
ncbi:hypothetical protein XELAEV_18032058mg [Xenopus laevis]|uniref:Uncharacterized protein n=1 Tax=Xenopus laevis TaxID=8355 RepID=A0A974CNR6_XENLA|nr:hypothetical protein XELAEV_18032058mg [Xenopus laevis]